MVRIKWILSFSVALNILLLAFITILNHRYAQSGFNRKAFDCQRGWTNSLESLHDTVDIVFLGNSITHGGAFDEAFADKHICNLGYPSDNLKGMSGRVDQIKALHPQKIFVMGGFNGLTTIDLQVFSSEYEELVKNIGSEMPDARIYLQSILPVNGSIKNYKLPTAEKINDANQIIKNISKKYNCVYIDLYSLYQKDDILPTLYTDDGVHLKEDAYSIWYNAINNFIYE